MGALLHGVEPNIGHYILLQDSAMAERIVLRTMLKNELANLE
jgi:hypothetical protein